VRTGAIAARWELTLRPSTRFQRSPGENESRQPGHPPLSGQLPGPASLTGEFLLANVNCASPWADVADVLMVPTPPRSHDRSAPSQWLANALVRHPGCAVAVTGGPNWCTALLRDGTMISQDTASGAAQATPERPADTAINVIPANLAMLGCLVHALLVAGRPISPLTWAQPQMTTPGPPRIWTTCGQAAGAPFSFGMVPEVPQTRRSASSRARTSTASGAPMTV
jgi:hypothetical protein